MELITIFCFRHCSLTVPAIRPSFKVKISFINHLSHFILNHPSPPHPPWPPSCSLTNYHPPPISQYPMNETLYVDASTSPSTIAEDFDGTVPIFSSAEQRLVWERRQGTFLRHRRAPPTSPPPPEDGSDSSISSISSLDS